uniref:Carboxylesterase type B domain-containing protein n=1 Tax=Lutzomyia longipalpis TaxID=7200 RepID=A0A1B0CB37_LUTLO
MGETEEKENGPSEAHEGEEPKETDKMLNKEDGGAKKNEDLSPEAIATETAETAVNSPENGEEIVKIAEEPKTEQTKETVPVTAEGREVKPKKIPIGGIKMPGFFTRGTKGTSKNEGDGADGELLETDEKNKPIEDNINNKNRASMNFFSNIRIRNPFKRSTDQQKVATENGNADQKAEDNEKVTIEEEATKDTAQPADQTQKRRLLNAIKLPQISNILPKRLRTGVANADVELGNGPHNKAGLASMETLDDSTKDPESKDTTDRAAIAKPTDEDLETVKLDNVDEKSQGKAEEAGASDKPKPWLERIRSYHCSIDDIAIVAGILVFLLLVGIICAFTFTGKTELTSAPVKDGRYVEAVTSCGPVEGLYDDGAFVFRGIPYATPPVDENRWTTSRPIDNINDCWNGTFKAHNSTPVCLQLTSNGTIVGVEDCLTLDVVTPHVRYDNPLPVVVLIGAESLSGDSPGKMRPSKRYARARDVIFVRPNFRVGAFGFLALDALSRSTHPPRSGNYGLSDIITALKWIKINIVNFGGDANSVTLFGHRAGATLVSAIVASPQAKDLFHRSWITSGSAIFPGKSLHEYERQNTGYRRSTKMSQC